MKLWRKNKSVKRELPSFLKVGLSRLNRRLISIANFLQRKTNRYSTGKKKFLLLLFVLVFITESSVVLVQSIKGKNKTLVQVNRIKTIPFELRKSNTPQLTKAEFIKVQKFKNYIDSLSTTVQGRAVKESLLHNRQKLMDSVSFLINLYLEKSKTIVK